MTFKTLISSLSLRDFHRLAVLTNSNRQPSMQSTSSLNATWNRHSKLGPTILTVWIKDRRFYPLWDGTNDIASRNEGSMVKAWWIRRWYFLYISVLIMLTNFREKMPWGVRHSLRLLILGPTFRCVGQGYQNLSLNLSAHTTPSHKNEISMTKTWWIRRWYFLYISVLVILTNFHGEMPCGARR